MTMAPQIQPRFFLYRFCLELDADTRNSSASSSLQFCTVRVPSYIQISLLRTTSFLSGAYVHDKAGTNLGPGFGRSVTTAWASFLEREAVVFDSNQHTPAFLTQDEWDFVWKHTQCLTFVLPCDLLRAFNAQFSRTYGTFDLLAAMINTFVLPQYLSRDRRVQEEFRAVWNRSLLVRDVLGMPPLSSQRNALPPPVSPADCRDKFLATLCLNLDRSIGGFRSDEARQDVLWARK